MYKIFLLLVFCGNIFAKDIGIGVGIGTNSGASIKKWINEKIALEGFLSIIENYKALYLDILWHNYESIPPGDLTGKLPLTYGAGFQITSNQKNKTGIRLNIGIDYLFKEIPFDFFSTLSPTLIITEKIKLQLNVSLGLRYYLNNAKD